MAPKALIFDKDGTLTDSSLFWKNFCLGVARDLLKQYSQLSDQQLLEALMELVGFRPDGSIIPESIVVSGTSVDIINGWIKIFSARGITLDREDLFLRFERDYRYGKVCPLYDGIAEVFKHFYDKGYKIALATSDNFNSSLYCCEKLGIDRYISVIASKDMVSMPKPHPDSMEYICRELNIKPYETVMIGDSENDMKFAKNCGAGAIFLNRSKTSKTADININDIKELKGLF